jgi:Rod binding domain-containing protein
MVGFDAKLTDTSIQADANERLLREKASEFEGILIAQILQKLNQCYRLDESEDSDSANESFGSLATSAVGGGLARSGGLGIGEMIVRSLQRSGVPGTAQVIDSQ